MLKNAFIAICFSMIATVSYAADQFVVFAAASLTNMLDELMVDYNKKNGTKFVGSYAASGALARQIESGSPAAIFISADPKWVDELEKKNITDKESRKDYAGNNLVLIANSESALTFTFSGRTTLNALLKKGERFAIGDPEYVPAGKYAQEALTYLKQWDILKPSLVFADNVRVVLAFVERDEAVLGAVYGSDAAASKNVKILADFPPESYPAIRYPIVIIRDNDNVEVRKFYKYLLSKDAAAVLKNHGFAPLF